MLSKGYSQNTLYFGNSGVDGCKTNFPWTNLQIIHLLLTFYTELHPLTNQNFERNFVSVFATPL